MANIFDLFQQISSKKSTVMPIEYIIVGLGNPGKQYEQTRHNAGFLALEYLAEKYRVNVNHAKYKAFVGEVTIAEKKVLLMKPQTFMNLSGEAVGEAVGFYKIPPEHVLVLSDDVSLDVGKLRVRRKGSDGGHNGLKSISACIRSEQYPRIKIGVGKKPHPSYDLADWVLSSFSKEEMLKLSQSFDILAEGVENVIRGDIDNAMQLCNGK